MADGDADLLKFYRSEIHFQSTLLSGRLNAFISSQSFHVIAYASATSGLIGQWGEPFALLFPPVVALLGLVLALQAWPGIKAAYDVIEEWRQRQDALLAASPELSRYDLHATARGPDAPQPNIANRHFRQGALFARHAPWIFALAWCYFGVLPVILALTKTG